MCHYALGSVWIWWNLLCVLNGVCTLYVCVSDVFDTLVIERNTKEIAGVFIFVWHQCNVDIDGRHSNRLLTYLTNLNMRLVYVSMCALCVYVSMCVLYIYTIYNIQRHSHHTPNCSTVWKSLLFYETIAAGQMLPHYGDNLMDVINWKYQFNFESFFSHGKIVKYWR